MLTLLHLLPLLACGSDCQDGYGRDNDGNCVPLGVASDDTGGGDDTSVGGDDTGEVLDPDLLVFGDVQACDAPLDEVSYTEVGAAWGLAGNGASSDHGEWGSAAVFDAEGDGDMDVVLAFPEQPIQLYRRDGDAFQAESLEGPESPWFLSLADVDGDGDLDLLAGGYGRLGAEAADPGLLLNDGGAFVAADLPAPPDGTGGVRELAPGDLDGDGDLDLYASKTLFAEEYEETDQVDYLLINQGDGTFENDTTALPAELAWGRAFDAQWFDWDGDGDQDLYVANDMGDEFVPNVLYENDGGALREANDDCYCDIAHLAMGVDVADMNNDGAPDMYLAAGTRNVYLESLGDGTYVDATEVTGANPLPGSWEMGWAGVMIDIDNNGLRDIISTQGDLWGEDEVMETTPESDLYVNVLTNNGVSFVDNAQIFGIDALGSWRAAVAVDHNGDGIVDPLLVHASDDPLLYLSDGCTAAGWLEVEAPHGSRVEVTAGGVTQTAWITTDSACGGARLPRAHFGLGDAAQVDALTITLPGGDTIAAEAPFEARRIVTLSDALR